jgi:hypothetical protein
VPRSTATGPNRVPRGLVGWLPAAMLGALTWLAQVGWLYAALEKPPAAYVAAAPLLLLVAGLLVLRGSRSSVFMTAARLLLLCCYPAAVAAVIASVPEATLERIHTPWSLLSCVATLLAYMAGAAISCAEPSPAPGPQRLLAQTARPTTGGAREWVRIAFSVTWFGAALVLATVAPLTPPWAEVERAWGPAAADAAVFSAVVAGALSVAMVAVFLASMLRRADAEAPLRPSALRARVAMLLLVALAGTAAYALVGS